MRIDNSQKKLLIVVALAVGAFVGLGWYPAHRDIAEVRRQIVSTQKQLDGVHGKADGFVELNDQVRRMRQELAATSKTIPDQNELAGLIREVSTRIEAQKLGDQSLNTRPTVEGDRYVTLPIEIKCTGDSMSAFGFVNQLEQMPQLVQVTGLFMGIDPKKPGVIETELTVNTFFVNNRKSEAGAR